MSKYVIPPYEGKFSSIVIFGPPGVGKGTQSKFLCQAGTLLHVSSGDIFRSLSPASPAGQLFNSYASQGRLVPDEATIAIWHNYVLGLISTNRYFPDQQYLLLDGLPRTVNQVKIISDYVDVKQIIVLEVRDQEELFKRLRVRAKTEGRQDDAEEAVLRKRMHVYAEETAQVIKQYPKEIVSYFNAQQRPLEVVRDVLNKLSPILAFPPVK